MYQLILIIINTHYLFIKSLIITDLFTMIARCCTHVVRIDTDSVDAFSAVFILLSWLARKRLPDTYIQFYYALHNSKKMFQPKLNSNKIILYFFFLYIN